MRDWIGVTTAALLALALAAGCQTRETDEGTSPAGEAAGAREVEEGDEAADGAGSAEGVTGGGSAADAEQAVADVNERWRQAALAGDAAALASLYAEDAVLLAPGMPTAKGRPAIQSAFATIFESPPSSVTIESDATIVSESGELAFDHGTYTMSGTTPAGEAWQDTGKFLGVLRNTGGEWTYIADTWNSDAPAM
jgi:uncharacterized protein (TIGR02246 family)